ncbi:MAG: DNA oxidative demethylase AlkB [Rhodanobacter sp.]
MMINDLFSNAPIEQRDEPLCNGAVVLRGMAFAQAPALQSVLDALLETAPFRHLSTPGGLRMSVAMTNAGSLGWVSDQRGYRYTKTDPQSGRPWPPMPDIFQHLASTAAAHAGFAEFVPDACLINRYSPGARLTLHQDHDERDFTQPIVSVSLGLPATFLFGGALRTDRTRRIALTHGDVVVWGGPARLYYHGILPLKPGQHETFGECRINLTFRHAGR